jgi:hypothetical protein
MNSATTAMLDGIKEACCSWGRAMRWVLTSDGEGYPSVASFERANQGDMDARTITLKQRFGEVMTQDALAVSLAIRRAPMMPEELHRVLFVHFVVPRWRRMPAADGFLARQEITVAMKAKELGYPRPKPYYVALDNGYHFLLGRIAIGPEVSQKPNVNTLDTQYEHATIVCTR